MKMVIKDYHTDKIHKFYSDYENFRSIDKEKVMNIERRRHPLLNDTNKFQIHNFGCSFVYGAGLEQEQTFPYLLCDEDYSSFNHGVRGAGMDLITKRAAEVYKDYNLLNNKNFVFTITIPHMFRRIVWDKNGNCIAGKPYEVGEINYPTQYFYFYHQYKLLNNLIGRQHIIWSTWGEHEVADSEVPLELTDTQFDCQDYSDDLGDTHPGSKSHKEYADRLKHLVIERRKKL